MPKADDEMQASIRKQVHEAIPDRHEVLRVHCIHCDRTLLRPRRVVEKMNRNDGFVACSNPCRKKHLEIQERVVSERVMRFPASRADDGEGAEEL